jgi:DNA polymerase-3 subunit alpha
MESLIKAGALTSLGDRSALLQNVNKILSLAQRQQQLKESGQSTMFDLWGEEVPVPTPSIVLATEKVPVKEILAWEKELTGVYLSEHPFASFAEKLNAETTLCGQIDVESEGQHVVVAGMVASVHHLFTRERKPFSSTLLEDLTGNIEVMVWPKLYTDTKDLWQEGNILLVEGKVKLRNDKVQLYCDRVKLYTPEETQITKPTIVAQPKKETIEVEETVVPPTPMEQTHVTVTITQ